MPFFVGHSRVNRPVQGILINHIRFNSYRFARDTFRNQQAFAATIGLNRHRLAYAG